MEERPLIGSYSGSKARVIFAVLVSLLFLFLVVIIILAVVAGDALKKNKEQPICPPAPPVVQPYDNSNDFPLVPHAPFNISNAGHNRTLQFETNQGTWMNVDISPVDGTLLFDTLGDIYTYSPGNGQVEVLRAGPAFESQARYSADGSKILFTSDISGCDNIWMMDLTTKQTTQITNETYHFVNNAFWIDEASIVAVKWYTSTRSISAGEIWIFDMLEDGQIDAGDRIVGRRAPGSQVGPEEPFPVVVNGTLYVYYSMNTADGVYWNYNKNPHQVIYTLFQYSDEEEGSQVVSSGIGGSARPIVSHSRKLLAFVRRTLFNTSLVIQDIETGNERILYSGLDPDQQESSAPSGVYPSFAFTNDDSHIIIWANGTFQQVDVQTGSAIALSLTIPVDLQLRPTTRFLHNISDGPTFSTKVVLSPSIPAGNKTIVAYTSVGATYLKNLETSEITPVPSSNASALQFWPSLSPNGQFLVHVVWNEGELSTIEIVDLWESKNYTVPTLPGRYSRPKFSPNFETEGTLVFIRLPGDSFTGSDFSLNPGIYAISINHNGNNVTFSGLPNLVCDYGYDFSFSSSGNEIFVQDGSYPMTVTEVSIASSNFGQDLKDVAEGLYATDVAVSPDKNYVAFVEFRNLQVASIGHLRSSSSAINISAFTQELQFTMLVSAQNAAFLSWAPDSSYLYYVWGPMLYVLTMPTLGSCGENCIAPNLKSYNLSVQVNSAINFTSILAFENVTLITMENDTQIVENGVIIVEGNVITALGTAEEVTIPESSRRFNLNGGFAMPGLIDGHAHWDSAYDYKPVNDWEMMVNLAFGVTTMHNPSADTIDVFTDSELIRAGKKVGPRVFSTGTILYGAGGPYHCEISSQEAAWNYIESVKQIGGWSVKSYNQPCRSARLNILDAAQQLEMNVVPEGGMNYFWNLNQIIDGHTTIEHSTPIAPLYNDVITLFAASGTAYCPTFIVNYGGLAGELYWYQHDPAWQNERLMSYSPQDSVQARTVRFAGAQDIDYHHFTTSKSVAEINLAGGDVVAGAHGQMQGIGLHWEMTMFNQSNKLTPIQVLQTATINAARAHGLDHQLGSLKVGKLADIIFYENDADPRVISNTRNVAMVLKDGLLYDAATLQRL